MDLKLIRNKFCAEGIFGRLLDVNGKQIAYTLEHAYPQADGSFAPTIPVGAFNCIRGVHQLADLVPFDTFEVRVSGHWGLLFHPGNYNKDSTGCILVGLDLLPTMILKSKAAFAALMALQTGIDTFSLTVENQVTETT